MHQRAVEIPPARTSVPAAECLCAAHLSLTGYGMRMNRGWIPVVPDRLLSGDAQRLFGDRIRAIGLMPSFKVSAPDTGHEMMESLSSI